MALSGNLVDFVYSGAPAGNVQGDPLLSLGGRSPVIFPIANLPRSAPYSQATLDGVSPALNQLSDSTVEGTDSRTVATGDWITVTTGVAAPFVAKVLDDTAGVLTLDRELPALTAASDYIRFSKAENIFPDATLAQVGAGVVDHRMLFMVQHSSTEGDMKMWIEKVNPGPATVEVMMSTEGTSSILLPLLADGEDDPFNPFGNVDGREVGGFTVTWGDAEKMANRTSSALATPTIDYGSLVLNDFVPFWLRRTIPAGSSGARCVFALHVRSDADPGTPDPDPFVTSFVFEFDIPELTYTATIAIDRTVYVRGATRVTGTVVDQFSAPVPNLNAWVEIDSGPGSIVSDQTGVTDANGQVGAVYTAPTTLTTDPVLKLIIPTNSEI